MIPTPNFLSRLIPGPSRSRSISIKRPDWSPDLRHFQANTRRPLPVRLSLAPGEAAGLFAIPARRLQALLRALAVLQKGETGEGRIAYEIDRASFAGIDDTYRSALKLFVAEEGRHARLLAILVTGLGGRLLRSSASSRLFTWARRLAGVRLKLLVLATAEIAGIVLYARFARILPAGVCRSWLREIVRDEAFHLRFHARCFHGWLSSRNAPAPVTGALARGVFLILWRLGVTAAYVSLVLFLRKELRDLAISRTRVWRAFWFWSERLERIVRESKLQA